MKFALRLAAVALPMVSLSAMGEDHGNRIPRTEFPNQEIIIHKSDETVIAPEEEASSIPKPLPREVISADPVAPSSIEGGTFQNPPSRVWKGPFLRRIIPSRYAKPFNNGPYRYEPRIGDIRDTPRLRTLPGEGYDGSPRETLPIIPPRDRGYFVIPRW